jgi:hypothetical protein
MNVLYCVYDGVSEGREESWTLFYLYFLYFIFFSRFLNIGPPL